LMVAFVAVSSKPVEEKAIVLFLGLQCSIISFVFLC
jgi:hypothetical protein